ncbi:MAG: sulfurtransferase TusA family protein [Magnetococcales bacterium]|nr:sulfurtransferase TusA family protein [Magnetococcales bacterium]
MSAPSLPPDPEWHERYSRQILLPEIGGHGQQRLNLSTVGIVADATGTILLPTLLYLAAAGVGHLRVTDHHPEPLAPILDWAKANNPTVRIETAPLFPDPAHLSPWLRGLDLLLDLDHAWPQLQAACLNQRLPLLTTWIGPEGRGWITGSRAGSATDLPCLACPAPTGSILPTPAHPPPQPEHTLEAPWDTLWHGLAGTLLATETLKSLLGLDDPSIWTHALSLDPALGDFQRLPRARNPACPLCARSDDRATPPATTNATTPTRSDNAQTNATDLDTLDISADHCPMTFVRVKLKLETLQPGQSLRVRLSGGEPLVNVPRTLREQGHRVSEPWEEEGHAGLFGLMVHKNDPTK